MEIKSRKWLPVTLPKAFVGWGGWVCISLWFAWLMSLSSGALPEEIDPIFIIPHIDKVLHFGFFGLGAGFLTLAVMGSTVRWNRRLGWVVLAALALIGAFDEVCQFFVPERSHGFLEHFGDWAADVLGSIVGVVGTTYLRPLTLRFPDETKHASLWGGVALFLVVAIASALLAMSGS